MTPSMLLVLTFILGTILGVCLSIPVYLTMLKNKDDTFHQRKFILAQKILCGCNKLDIEDYLEEMGYIPKSHQIVGFGAEYAKKAE